MAAFKTWIAKSKQTNKTTEKLTIGSYNPEWDSSSTSLSKGHSSIIQPSKLLASFSKPIPSQPSLQPSRCIWVNWIFIAWPTSWYLSLSKYYHFFNLYYLSFQPILFHLVIKSECTPHWVKSIFPLFILKQVH